MDMILGILAVSLGGLCAGGGAWPFKLMRKYKFEHWWFIGTLGSLFIVPWVVTLLGCPDAIGAIKSLPAAPLIKANVLSLAWGVANITCGLCYYRIGVALTGAVLAGLGVSVGTIMPMVFKGSGLFQGASDIGSPAGLVVVSGVLVMLVGVVLAAVAGFGRDKTLAKSAGSAGNAPTRVGKFSTGLIMAAVAGILSAGMALSFVYSQGPVVDAVKSRGAGEIPANFAVWALGLLAGAAINVGYAVYLLTKNKSWGVFKETWKEAGLAGIIVVNSVMGFVLLGTGMRLLGAFGAAVGFGIQQAMQMTGTQAVGFVSGEWKGVHGKPRRLMYAAIATLIVAGVIMAYGKKLAQG
jgi:L-rhamnose-H+ transport protein